MRFTFRIVVFIALISFLISGCTKSNTPLIEIIQNEFPSDYQNEGILHIEVVGNGLLVFFKNNNGLGAGYFKQQSNHWEWASGSGYAKLFPDDGLSVIHINRDEINLYLSYGAITDSHIFEVRSSERRAKTVQLSDGTRIWFITYEDAIGQDGSLPLISGLSKEGEQITTIPAQ